MVKKVSAEENCIWWKKTISKMKEAPLEELEEIFNTRIMDKEQALQYAELLQEKGAKNVEN